MRYITSIFLGIITSFFLVWLMTELINKDVIVTPEPPVRIAVLHDTQIETKPEQVRPVVNQKPTEPQNPPSHAISIDAVSTDNSQHQVKFSYHSEKVMPSIRTFDGMNKMPVLPKPVRNRPTIQLDYKHPVTYPREAKRHGIEGYVVIENVVDRKGNVIQVRIVDATDRKFIKAVKDSARLWKYAQSKQETRAHRTRIAFNLED